MISKIKEWLKRYTIPEIIGISSGLIFGNLSLYLSNSIILSAIVFTWSENLGYYLTITYRDLKQHHKLTISHLLKQIRNMTVEFGPAEYLDSLLIRPVILSLFPLFIANYSLALLLGALAANISFYIPTIISYELRKKVFKD